MHTRLVCHSKTENCSNTDHNDVNDDSDATTLDLEMSPQQTLDVNAGDSDSSSLESIYEMDPDYSGPPPQSQPCQKHGIYYVPVGMRRRCVKKKKVKFDED